MRIASLVFLALVALGPAASSQLTDSASRALVSRLRVGDTVRLYDRVHGRLQAPLRSISGATLYLLTDSADTAAIAASGIDSLWVRGSGAGDAALTGGIIGGLVAGIAMALLIKSEGCGDESSCDSLIPLAAGGGGLIGGVIGVVAGSRRRMWHRRYP